MADTEKKPDPTPVEAAPPPEQQAADAKTKGPKQTNAGERS